MESVFALKARAGEIDQKAVLIAFPAEAGAPNIFFFSVSCGNKKCLCQNVPTHWTRLIGFSGPM
jgi:hypothetical protein